MFLPGESQGRRSLVGCCLWGHTDLSYTLVVSLAMQDFVHLENDDALKYEGLPNVDTFHHTVSKII